MDDGRGSGAHHMVVGLGANLGQPELTFRLAVKELRRTFDVEAGSRLYRGPAMRLPGSSPQPDYLNAAVLLAEIRESIPEVVSELLRIERQLGRIRGEHWGPRVLDLDLLWASELTCDDPAALVPHPGLTTRAFALRPLLELVPHARHPRSGESYGALLGRIDPDNLRVVGGTEWACAT